MKFLIALLLTAFLSFISGIYLPWWGIAIAALLSSLLVRQRSFPSFLAGFLGVFLLWVALSAWIDSKNNSILSARIGELLGVGDNSFLLILITGLAGGLVAGFAALTGSYLRTAK
ncbi:MAG TPA: hypothetical protein PKC69_11325 [Chitinophagaceae bacterium]|nr:hypothetical protein [Chitinophagaceae bacterium]